MQLKRTRKVFKKDNLPLDFVRKAFALAGLSGVPLKFQEEHYKIEELFHGVKEGSTISPWNDKHLVRGYVKKRNAVTITPTNGFDTKIIIWEDNGRIQGYYIKSHTANYACDEVAWCNLLLEYNFLKIK